MRYAEIAPQLDSRQTTLEDVSSGACRFVIGLSKKVLLANVLYELITAFQQSRDLSVLYFWLYAVSFALQLYFDFSGYSDMAIGLGRIFGFRFQENFNYPYISGSITEFWRRWHISLGSWFRDYVYIPLGGNRVSKAKWLRNILVVWMLTGLWHGASWNFVLWGLGFAVLLVAEKLVYGRLLQRTHVLKHVYTLLLVTLSFVLFNADSVSEAVLQLGAMFGAGGLPLVSTEGVYYLKSYAGTFLFAAIGATPLVSNAISRFGKTRFGAQALTVLQPLVMLALLAACTAFLVDGSFNPFLYFRF
ncbi:MAG: MBOAT family O-acyltransferase [Oscillospiraceae bacterium]